MPPATPSIDELHKLESEDFSLVLGGPLFQLWRRSHLSDEVGNMPHRRAAAAVLLAWVPLLLLSLFEGRAWGRIELPFLRDLELHARLLVAMPLLILAELVVHRRMRLVVRQFVEDGLIPDASRSRFDLAVASALRLRNSPWAEILLVLLVYGIGVLVVWRTRLTLDVSSWYGVVANGQLRLTAAGWWLACVSLPLFQFLLLRWYFRLFLWARFLWRVSRLDLELEATHPDKAGGLGFLGDSISAFVPLAAAQGVLFSGMIADRIFFAGAKVTDFQIEVVGGAVLLLLVFAGPLTLFAIRLARVKRVGLRDYGALGQDYVRQFRRKWMSGTSAGEPLVGSGDIQSLADLGNSYSAAEQMRFAPIQLRSLLAFLAAFLAPLLPLLLTTMSVEKLVARLVGIVF